jgi:hypothetical protein
MVFQSLLLTFSLALSPCVRVIVVESRGRGRNWVIGDNGTIVDCTHSPTHTQTNPTNSIPTVWDDEGTVEGAECFSCILKVGVYLCNYLWTSRKRKRGRGKEEEEKRKRKRGRGKEGEEKRERKRGRGKEGEEKRERKRGRGKEGEEKRERKDGEEKRSRLDESRIS